MADQSVPPGLSKQSSMARRRQSSVFIDKDAKLQISKSLKQRHEITLHSNDPPMSLEREGSFHHSLVMHSTTIPPASTGSLHKHRHSAGGSSRVHQIVMVARLVSLLDKQQAIARQSMLAAVFYQWKCSLLSPNKPPSSHSRNSGSQEQVEEPVATRRGSTDGYQRRYLALFAESERMREQYLELKKSTTNKNEVLKRRGISILVKIFLRYHINNHMRRAFDVWLCNTQAMAFAVALRQESMHLDVGLKQVEAELQAKRQLEEHCIFLRRELALSMAFYQWKINKCQTQLMEMRSSISSERRELALAVRQMRDYVQKTSKLEAAAVTSVKDRDATIHSVLDTIRLSLSDKMKTPHAHLS